MRPPATPVLTTTKSTYSSGETIVVNYSHASGAAQDWVGLYSPGAANSAVSQWCYTDGSKDPQKGTPGLINGSVSFPGGISTPGAYEARLFFNASYNLQATVSFNVQTAPPGQASAPSPASGSTGVSVNPTLSWTAGAGASSHNVYFGTNPTISSGDFRGGQSGTVYSPVSLNPLTTYYWRIDEVNSVGVNTGLEWNFTTASTPSVTTSNSIYNRAEQVSVNFFNASGNAHDWIGLFASGTANTAYLQWSFVDGTQVGSTSGIISGTVNFPSGLPDAGNYEARLFFVGSFTLEASTPFSVQAPTPTVSTGLGTYTRGSTITANFTNASGSAKDWIGLFALGAANTA